MRNELRFVLLQMPLRIHVATLILRLLYGGMFVHYGYNKLAAYSEMAPKFGDIIGIGAGLSFNLVIFAELVCGFLVLIGFLTRLSVIPIFITMGVAFFIAHANDPFDTKAVSFIFLILSVVVFMLGSGRYSVDALLFPKQTSKTN